MAAAFCIGSRGTITSRAKLYLKPEIIAEATSEIEKASLSRAGKESGKARRDEADTTSIPHALKLAKQITLERPYTQTDLNAEIRSKWLLKHYKCPESRTLIKQISQWQRAGIIPRRPRKHATNRSVRAANGSLR